MGHQAGAPSGPASPQEAASPTQDSDSEHAEAAAVPSNKRQHLTQTPAQACAPKDTEGAKASEDAREESPPPATATNTKGHDEDDHDAAAVSSDDGDDLLIVKRRDVLSESNAASAAEGGVPLGGVELRGNKKRKKLRIDPGRTSGARTVFDETGESLQPLALLAREQLDRSAGLHHDDDAYGSWTCVCVHQNFRLYDMRPLDGRYAAKAVYACPVHDFSLH